MDSLLSVSSLTSPDLQGSGESRFHLLPGGLVAIELAEPVDTAGLELRAGGVALPPPVCTLRLNERVLVVARHATGPLALHGNNALLAEGECDEANGCIAALFTAPDLDERLRLLRFLAATCVPLFRLYAHAPLAGLLRRLALPLAGSGAARPLSRHGADGLSLWQVPGEQGAPWHLLTSARVARVKPPLGGTLFLEGPLPAGSLLLPPAGPPLRLAEAKAALPHLLESQGDGAPQDRVLIGALGRRPPADELTARLLRDRRLLAPPAQPRRLDDAARPLGGALELALADGAGGVFLAGWLRDPLGLVSGGLLLRDLMTNRAEAVPPARLYRFARPDLSRTPFARGDSEAGFIAHLPDAARAGPVAQWGLALRLASGEAIELTAPPGLLAPAVARDLVLRAVPPAALRTPMLDECLAPAVARLQRAALAELGTPEVIEIGRPGHATPVAVVIPLYRNLRFLRFQLAAFSRDAAFRAVARLVFVLDSPEQRDEVEHLLRGLHAVHDLPTTLAVMRCNGGYASACNAGAALAPEAEHLLLLNSDVVPDAPGWLAHMLAPLERNDDVLATGPKLLFEDGSVQHAGLFFSRHGAEGDWLNGHYGKGLSRRHPGALRERAVPGVTGAALLVRRAAWDAVGGLCTDYVVGDYEDSDLCLRLRGLGGEIRYVPTAELFHFERQSIIGHGGYARTLACAYNRRLHHLRWDARIEALMAGFAEPDAT